MFIECESCGRGFERRGSRGRVPRFCGQRCRKRASRVVKAPFANDKRVWVRASGKRPVMVDGSAASSTNPATCASFAEVQKSNAGDGFGVVLDGSELGCYDFDSCFDVVVLLPVVREIIAGIASLIVCIERSVSCNGRDVFVEADKQRGFRRDGVEFYTSGRFIRTTLSTYIL